MLGTTILAFAALSIHRVAGLPHASHWPSPSTRILRVAHQEMGILTVSFEPSKPSNESLTILDVTHAGYHPGWLTAHNNKIYSVSRTDFPNNASMSGGVFAFQKHVGSPGDAAAAENSLDLLNSVSADGLGSVYCGVSRDGRTMGVADIDGSTVSIHPLTPSGLIDKASYIFTYNLSHPGPGTNDSQEISNPHQAIFDPSGQYIFVPDRGADRLYVYDVVGPHDVTQIRNITLPPGTGPRHIAFNTFNATRTFMYLVSELDNTVRVFTLDGVSNLPTPCTPYPASSLKINLIQTASTLGPGTNRTAPNNQHQAAEIAISSDGKFLYASNRNTVTYASDTITIYSVHSNSPTNHLEYLGQNDTFGKIPRHFSLSTDTGNQYVAVGNEVSNNLIILERDRVSGFMGNGVVGNLSLGDFDITLTMGPMTVIWDQI